MPEVETVKTFRKPLLFSTLFGLLLTLRTNMCIVYAWWCGTVEALGIASADMTEEL